MNSDRSPVDFDVIVIGGSYAGLSAALQLARARRQLLVIDAGRRRNRFATAAHGFLGQDGRPPQEIVADGRAQLLTYPTVQWRDDTATRASRTDDGFAVSIETGAIFHAKRLILAIGVIDELPAIPGLVERWGTGVFHCPYCHGYELDEGPIGVLATGPMSLHQGLMLPDWGPTTLFTNGTFEPDSEQLAELARRNVAIEPEQVARIEETATVVLASGRRVVLAGLFTASQIHPASDIAEQLDCAMEEEPLGVVVQTNETKETSVPGVFACDVARTAGNIAMTVGDGALAGAAAHRSLMFG